MVAIGNTALQLPLHSYKYPGMYALVDAADFEMLSQYRWYPRHGRSGVYAYARIDGKNVYMHRLLMQAVKGEYVDHINHQQLDNRRQNLRVVGNSENQANRSGLRSDNTSGYVGVYRRRNTWFGEAWKDGKKYQIHGGFKTPEEAARARDRKVFELFGEYGHFNFPEEVAA